MAVNNFIKETAIKNNDLYRSEPKYPKQSLIVSLPIPQSINHMYHNTRRGGKTLTKTAQEYIRVSRAKIKQVIEDTMFKIETNSSWLYLDMVIYMPDRRKRDSHNMLKLLLDTIESIAFEDDYYVMPRIQSVELDNENPRIDLVLKPQRKRDRINVLRNFPTEENGL